MTRGSAEKDTVGIFTTRSQHLCE